MKGDATLGKSNDSHIHTINIIGSTFKVGVVNGNKPMFAVQMACV